MAAANAKPARMTPSELIDAAAKAALDDAGGDLSDATAMMIEAASLSIPLREALLAPFLEQACREVLRRQIQAVRREAWTGQKAHTAGVSKPDTIAEQQQFYAKQSADMGAKARWLRLIGQSLPDGKAVSEVLTDKRLRELQAEAARGE